MKRQTYLRYFRVTVPMNGENVTAVAHDDNERVVPMNLEYVRTGDIDGALIVCGLIVTETLR